MIGSYRILKLWLWFIVVILSHGVNVLVESNSAIFADLEAQSLVLTRGPGDWMLSMNHGQDWESFIEPHFDPISNDHIFTASQPNDESKQLTLALLNDQKVYFTSSLGKVWQSSSLPHEDWVSFALNSEGGVLYALSRDKGTFVSQDKGKHWKNTNINESSFYHWKKIVCNYIGKHSMSALTNSEVYYSEDYGESYTNISPPIHSGTVVDMTMSSDGQFLVVATTQNIYRSFDQGRKWEEVMTSTHPIQSVICTASGASMIAIVEAEGLLLSSDYGSHWKVVSKVGTGLSWSGVVMDSTGQKIVAIASSPTNELLYASDDQGRSWTTLKCLSPNRLPLSLDSRDSAFELSSPPDHKTTESLPANNELAPVGIVNEDKMKSLFAESLLLEIHGHESASLETFEPSFEPTMEPTSEPITVSPTLVPTLSPSATPVPSTVPSAPPSLRPTITPTVQPSSLTPSFRPTRRPTVMQTSLSPTVERISMSPTVAPSVQVYPIFQMSAYLTIDNIYSTTLTAEAVDALITTLSVVLNVSKSYIRYLGVKSFTPSSSNTAGRLIKAMVKTLETTSTPSGLRGGGRSLWAFDGMRSVETMATTSYQLVAETSIEIPLVNYAVPTTTSSSGGLAANVTQALYANLTKALTTSIASQEFVNTLQLQAQYTNASDFDSVVVPQVNFTRVSLKEAPVNAVPSSSSDDKYKWATPGAISGIVLGCIAVLLIFMCTCRKTLRRYWYKRWRTQVRRAAAILTLEELGLTRHAPIAFYPVEDVVDTQPSAPVTFAQLDDITTTDGPENTRARKEAWKVKRLFTYLKPEDVPEDMLGGLVGALETVKQKPKAGADGYDNSLAATTSMIGKRAGRYLSNISSRKSAAAVTAIDLDLDVAGWDGTGVDDFEAQAPHDDEGGEGGDGGSGFGKSREERYRVMDGQEEMAGSREEENDDVVNKDEQFMFELEQPLGQRIPPTNRSPDSHYRKLNRTMTLSRSEQRIDLSVLAEEKEEHEEQVKQIRQQSHASPDESQSHHVYSSPAKRSLDILQKLKKNDEPADAAPQSPPNNTKKDFFDDEYAAEEDPNSIRRRNQLVAELQKQTKHHSEHPQRGEATHTNTRSEEDEFDVVDEDERDELRDSMPSPSVSPLRSKRKTFAKPQM